MSVESEARHARPDFPWLSADDPQGVEQYLTSRGWLAPDEQVLSAARAGDGNMNLTLFVRTSKRQFILKQARPWVEKYPEIAAPWDRSLFEIRFYRRVAHIPELAARMPALIDADPETRVILLEAVQPARDRSDLYAGAPLAESEVGALSHFLAVLHAETRGAPDPTLRNTEMRALNHAHIFVIPLESARLEGDLDLDALEPGLRAGARAWADDTEVRSALRVTGERYLGDGPCLLHGDFFPGSWLVGSDGLRVIDPEFCFQGPPEFDLGVAVAHLALADRDLAVARLLLSEYAREMARREGDTGPAFDSTWLARFAAAEVMRRLIGVAQLPIPFRRADEDRADFRCELLERARRALVGRRWEALWS